MHIAKKSEKGTVFSTDFINWQESLSSLLGKSGLVDTLRNSQRILIKPNLVEAKKPPITTPVSLITTLVDLLQEAAPHCAIQIGEGCGSSQHDTWHIFE